MLTKQYLPIYLLLIMIISIWIIINNFNSAVYKTIAEVMWRLWILTARVYAPYQSIAVHSHRYIGLTVLCWKVELVSSRCRDSSAKCRWTGRRWSPSASICALESSLSRASVAVERSWKFRPISGRSWPATLKPSASERGREEGVYDSNLSLLMLATLKSGAVSVSK